MHAVVGRFVGLLISGVCDDRTSVLGDQEVLDVDLWHTKRKQINSQYLQSITLLPNILVLRAGMNNSVLY